MYRYVGDMSKEQEEALEVFRKYVQVEMGINNPRFDDYTLLRFLRARKFDMDKTRLMWVTFIKWREENGVDTICDVCLGYLNLCRLLNLMK